MRYLLLCLVGTLLLACHPSVPTEQLDTHVSTLQLSANGVQLELLPPDGWWVYELENSLVLSEYEQALLDNGRLRGLLVHIWIPSLDDVVMDETATPHDAHDMLQTVIEAPDVIGSSAVTTPSPFRWAGHDAAYYLLNDGLGHMALVIMLIVPNETQTVMIRVDAPIAQAQRARAALPALFPHLVVNGTPLPATDLHALPNPLPVPPHGGTNAFNE